MALRVPGLLPAAILIIFLGADGRALGQPISSLPDTPRNPYARPTLSELLDRASTIVAGEVLSTRAAWTADRTEIFTTVVLRPDRRFRGGRGSLIRFRVPGGTVGDTRLTVTHSPVFAEGARVLVFLTGRSGKLPRVTGGAAGKRLLRLGLDGEERLLPGFPPQAAWTGNGSTREPVRTLNEFAAAVTDLEAAGPRR